MPKKFSLDLEGFKQISLSLIPNPSPFGCEPKGEGSYFKYFKNNYCNYALKRAQHCILSNIIDQSSLSQDRSLGRGAGGEGKSAPVRISPPRSASGSETLNKYLWLGIIQVLALRG